MALFGALPSRTSVEWFETSCAHAALAGLAGRAGSGIAAADGKKEADQAIELLKKAIEIGLRSPDAFRTEDALDPLRNRTDFKLLMMDLAFPANPFAE